MIGYAIKAPSGHNTQPWLFRIREEESMIQIIPDMTRELPVVDKEHRELFISLGCATENLCIAARDMGYEPTVIINEQNNINVSLKELTVVIPEPLCPQIEKRQTNRSIYDSRTISAETMRELEAVPMEKHVHSYSFMNHTDVFKVFLGYVVHGDLLQMGYMEFVDELKKWMRYNKKHSEAMNDGLSYAVFGAPNLPKFISRYIMGLFLNIRTQARDNIQKLNSSSHLFLLTTDNNTIIEWINLGRSLQRLLLTMTEKGIANAYANQPCEEESLATDLRKEMGLDGEYPTIIMRIGYAKPMPYSRRKKIEEVCVLI